MLNFISENKNRIILALLFFAAFLILILRLDQYLEFNPDGQLLSAKINDFLTTFRSIFIQAIPFVLFGTVISGIVTVFVKEELLLKLIPKNRVLSHFVISFFGVLMPVCECGNVPVARSFILKGFKVSHVFTFLLAAPIINPVTLFAMWEAFQDPIILIARVVGAFFIANFIGILLSFKKDDKEFLTNEFYEEVCHVHDYEPERQKLKEFLNIFQREFILVIEMLVIGGIIASLSQTFIPREIILSIGSNPIFSIIAMILFSFVISVCSSVDSFIVLPYTSTFTSGSIVSYLLFGPMIDIKILTLMKTTFRNRILIIVTILVTLFSILFGLLTNYLL